MVAMIIRHKARRNKTREGTHLTRGTQNLWLGLKAAALA